VTLARRFTFLRGRCGHDDLLLVLLHSRPMVSAHLLASLSSRRVRRCLRCRGRWGRRVPRCWWWRRWWRVPRRWWWRRRRVGSMPRRRGRGIGFRRSRGRGRKRVTDKAVCRREAEQKEATNQRKPKTASWGLAPANGRPKYRVLPQRRCLPRLGLLSASTVAGNSLPTPRFFHYEPGALRLFRRAARCPPGAPLPAAV
jgi:hypothetical protein